MGTERLSISFSGVKKQFGGTVALRGIDLDIDEPGIVGIAGPNGSGKTTLIRCLLGLLSPTDGSTTVGETRSPAMTGSQRRDIGYMPQHRALYEDLTVRENLTFFARLYGVPDREAAIERTLADVALADRADSRIATLSGGMIRRASLACALVHDPALLVLDEPTVGLDPKLRASMWDAFRARRDDGAIILVSTHYLGEVSQCDRVLFLRDGRVLADDTPAGHRERTGTDSMEDAFLALLEGAA
ncbi:MAG: ABC transporter ATP-binding protein [Halorhabdus sp.]